MTLFMQTLTIGLGNPDPNRTFLYNDGYLPMMNYMAYVFQFTWVIVLLLAILGAYRIYYRWQSGEDGITQDIFKWTASLLTVLTLSVFLNYFFENSGNNYAKSLPADTFNVDSKPAQISPLTPLPVTPTPSPTPTLPTIPANPSPIPGGGK